MNSPEAIAMMQRGSLAQARAMDEKAGEGTAAYITNKQNLTLGKGAESSRHAGAMEGIDLNRSDRAINTQDKALANATNWEGTRQSAALTNKALSTQDWQTNKALTDELSNAQLEGIGLNQQQFNAGMGYRTADLAERNAGANNVGNYGQNQLNYALQSGQMANNFGNTAMDAYKTAYGYEAPQAGWGAKMLAAAGGAALNMVVPGMGTAVTGAYNSAAPPQAPGAYGTNGSYGYPGGYGSSPYGTGPYGTPPFLPQQQQGGTGGWQNLYSTIGGLFKPSQSVGMPANDPMAWARQPGN
jgi:hypothetical protein